MQAVANTYLRLVPFIDFNLWDVKRYYLKTALQFDNVVTLRDILIPYQKNVSKEEMIRNKWQIISKINFGGELFLRDFDEINTYKGNVTLVPENAIIYSKINVRHGCIYYHDKGQIPFGVSSEYPTFKFDENKISGKFLHKVLRSAAFKKLLTTKTTGISKARVKKDEFLDIQIPLPSLKEQESLIANYYNKIEEAESLAHQASTLDAGIKNYFFSVLGIDERKEIESKKGLNVIEYINLSKWSLNYINKDVYDFESSKFKTERLKNLLVFFEGGKTPSKSRNDFWNGNIYWTSPKDFNGRIAIEKAEDKISELGVKEAGMKVYPKGTILSVFRSGILQHSFPTAITQIETAINQDLKAYSLKDDLIDKKYYLYFVHTFKKYILSLASKKSVTVESINTEDFFEILIPLPPLNIQKEISNKITGLKNEIDDLKSQKMMLEHTAEEQFEKAIFNS